MSEVDKPVGFQVVSGGCLNAAQLYGGVVLAVNDASFERKWGKPATTATTLPSPGAVFVPVALLYEWTPYQRVQYLLMYPLPAGFADGGVF